MDKGLVSKHTNYFLLEVFMGENGGLELYPSTLGLLKIANHIRNNHQNKRVMVCLGGHFFIRYCSLLIFSNARNFLFMHHTHPSTFPLKHMNCAIFYVSRSSNIKTI